MIGGRRDRRGESGTHMRAKGTHGHKPKRGSNKITKITRLDCCALCGRRLRTRRAGRLVSACKLERMREERERLYGERMCVATSKRLKGDPAGGKQTEGKDREL